MKRVIVVMLLGLITLAKVFPIVGPGPVVFDVIKFVEQKAKDKIVNANWTQFLDKFKKAYDTFMSYRSGIVLDHYQMKPESFDILKEISDLQDFDKYLANPYLRNFQNVEIWADLFQKQTDIFQKFKGLAPETEATQFDEKIMKDEELSKYYQENQRIEQERLKDIQNKISFIADMRDWEKQRADKMKEYVDIALKVTEAEKYKQNIESSAETDLNKIAMPLSSQPKMKAVGAALELENLYLKMQQVALARVKLESWLKEKTMELDQKKRYQILVDKGLVEPKQKKKEKEEE